VRRVTRWVGGGVDFGLERLAAVLEPLAMDAEAAPSLEREAMLAALNGVVGDHLEASGIRWRCRCSSPRRTCARSGGAARRPDPPPRPRPLPERRAVARNGHDHGACLAAELGFNSRLRALHSGQSIATNGASWRSNSKRSCSRAGAGDRVS
jgi:hypothetical protein